MYHLAISIQILSIVFCATATFLLYDRINKVLSKNLLASSVFAIIFGVGYLMEMLAKDEGEAMYALTTQYIGLCFVALFFAIYTTELYDFFKMPIFVWDTIFIFNLVTFIGVLTSGYHNFYYTEKTFVTDGLFPHLETRNGPWFYAFMMVLLGMMIYIAVMFIIGTFKKARRERRMNILAVIALLIGIGLMVGSFSVGFNGYEPISAMCCFVLGITSLVMMGSKTSAIINQAYEESYMNSPVGQIIVTKDMRFIECNKKAIEIYPPSAGFKKGQILDETCEGLSLNKDNSKLSVNGKVYSVTYQELDSKFSSEGGRIIFLTDITELESQRTTDEVTGLFNRHAFYDKVNEIMAVNPDHLAVAITDLNGLKAINDTWGHPEGDAAIMLVSQALEKAYSEKSFIFRFGGDEFVVLSTADAETFDIMSGRVEAELAKININRKFNIAVAQGVAKATAAEGIDIKKMMNSADELMYLDKKRYYQENHIERRHV